MSSLTLSALLTANVFAAGQPKTSWRYYRPGNTGIQGDTNEALWIGPDGDPWIGGYDPLAEEGGVAKFVQAQDRWFNVSNIDYQALGSANDTGHCRATDIEGDGLGNIWIGTYRGLLRMNLAQGPRSLVRYGNDNSPLPGGVTQDVSLAPDGTVWVSASSSVWGGGGLTRFDPVAKTWRNFPGHGGDKIAVQPKPGGGYFVWCSPVGYEVGNVDRWDSTSQTWTVFAPVAGNPSHIPAKDSVDAVGNLWIKRWVNNQLEERLQILKPDGTWTTPPLPPPNGPVSEAAVKPFGTLQCLIVDGFMHLQSFNGSTWTDLGPVPHSAFIDAIDRDAQGNVWLCGTGMGGALKRTASNGVWQRYRITNTSQFDLFNKDLSLDPFSQNVYVCANASSGVGGMARFDGIRWKTYVNDLGYGLSGPWPFGSPQSEALLVRPSNGKVVVNPLNDYSHEFDGTAWTAFSGGPDQVQNYTEDSTGRVWVANHYGGIGYFVNGAYTFVEAGAWFNKVVKDTVQPGAVWGVLGPELVRTDGVHRFSAPIDSVPGLTGLGAEFNSLVVDADGKAWAGTYSSATTSGNALVKVDPATGQKQAVFRYGVNWPFPGQYVQPLARTSDGRLWMAYGREFPFDDMGLLWWDGAKIGTFPAPPNGEWRFGGLPHYIITDLEVRPVAGGYELWMACFSRGIAVLKVQYPTPGSPK